MEKLQAKPRTVLLYRASSKKQTDSDNDIPLQRNILKPWAEQKGWEFVKEFVDAYTTNCKSALKKSFEFATRKTCTPRKVRFA